MNLLRSLALGLVEVSRYTTVNIVVSYQYDFGVDLFGIVGDIAAPIAPVGTVIWATSELAELTSVGKSWDQLEIGNPSDAMIDVGMPIAQSMKLAPQWGGLANTASLIVNLMQGFAYTP